MPSNEIILQRLRNQQIGKTSCKKPEELVSRLCGMQAQDYESMKWAIGIRLPGMVNKDVEQALAKRKIIRSWFMRGTLHVAAAKDVHWLLDLLAPRIIASGASRYRQLGLREADFKKCNSILIRSLHGNKECTREELSAALNKNGMNTDGQRLIHLLQRAALEKIICFGTKRESKFTFTLLDEQVAFNKTLKREEALAEITKRYFTSHGPATLRDFTWWSGLTATDAKTGIASAGSFLQKEKTGEQAFWLAPDNMKATASLQPIFFLPAFDEYVMGYKDRSAFLKAGHTKQVISSNGIFYPIIIVNGQVAGTWKRISQKDGLVIEMQLFNHPGKKALDEIKEAAQPYGAFVGKKLVFI